MSKSNTRERPARDGWLMVLYGLLLLVGLALLTFGVIRAITGNDLTLMAFRSLTPKLIRAVRFSLRMVPFNSPILQYDAP